MSLQCHECRRLVGPSEDLPGREATMVYPVVQAQVWVQGDFNIAWVTKPVPVDEQICLCLTCIARQIPEARRSILQLFFETYAAECEHRAFEQSQKGRWIAFESDEYVEARAAADAYLAALDKFATNTDGHCLICSAAVKTQAHGWFGAGALDRAYSGERSTDFIGEHNYSWSDYKVGGVFVQFCFFCFRICFPRCFTTFGGSLSETAVSSLDEEGDRNEIHLTDEVVRYFKQHMGLEGFEELLAQHPEVIVEKDRPEQ